MDIIDKLNSLIGEHNETNLNEEFQYEIQLIKHALENELLNEKQSIIARNIIRDFEKADDNQKMKVLFRAVMFLMGLSAKDDLVVQKSRRTIK